MVAPSTSEEGSKPNAFDSSSATYADVYGTGLIIAIILLCLGLALLSDLTWGIPPWSGQLLGVASQAIGYILVFVVLLVRAAAASSRSAAADATHALRTAIGCGGMTAGRYDVFDRLLASQNTHGAADAFRFVLGFSGLGLLFTLWRWQSMHATVTLQCALGQCLDGSSSSWNPIMSWQWLIQITVLPLSAAAVTGLQLSPVWRASRAMVRFVRTLGVRVSPTHPDGSGGLAPIGRFCLRAGSPLLAGSLLLGLHGFGVAFGGISSSVAAASVSGIAAICLAALCALICAPVWVTHQAMLAERQRYEAAVAVQADRLASAAQAAVETGQLSKLDELAREAESLRRFYPDNVGFPTWPVDLPRRYLAIGTQVFGVMGSAVALYKSFKEVVHP